MTVVCGFIEEDANLNGEDVKWSGESEVKSEVLSQQAACFRQTATRRVKGSHANLHDRNSVIHRCRDLQSDRSSYRRLSHRASTNIEIDKAGATVFEAVH